MTDICSWSMITDVWLLCHHQWLKDLQCPCHTWNILFLIKLKNYHNSSFLTLHHLQKTHSWYYLCSLKIEKYLFYVTLSIYNNSKDSVQREYYKDDESYKVVNVGYFNASERQKHTGNRSEIKIWVHSVSTFYFLKGSHHRR